jgi:APA family basic amino acid/polyamine antiporter
VAFGKFSGFFPTVSTTHWLWYIAHAADPDPLMVLGNMDIGVNTANLAESW